MQESSDAVSDGDRYAVDVEPGDVLCLGTDGLYDNMHVAPIVDVLSHTDLSVEQMARLLAARAQTLGASKTHPSPFALRAAEAKLRFMGGKMDDITVVVARVVHE